MLIFSTTLLYFLTMMGISYRLARLPLLPRSLLSYLLGNSPLLSLLNLSLVPI